MTGQKAAMMRCMAVWNAGIGENPERMKKTRKMKFRLRRQECAIQDRFILLKKHRRA